MERESVYHDMKLGLIREVLRSLGRLSSLMRITELKGLDDSLSGEALELSLQQLFKQAQIIEGVLREQTSERDRLEALLDSAQRENAQLRQQCLASSRYIADLKRSMGEVRHTTRSKLLLKSPSVERLSRKNVSPGWEVDLGVYSNGASFRKGLKDMLP